MSAIVEQLTNGITVRCADGAVFTCKPLTLRAAKRVMELWKIRFDPKADPVDRAQARFAILEAFQPFLPPEIEDHLSPGDLENLLPDFFWCATGASVPAMESTPTGTPPSDSTSPSGASSPTSP